jgi:hypothetical protein
MRCTSLVLTATLAACAGDERGAPPMPPPPIVEGPGITIDEDARDAIVEALRAQLQREMAAQPGEVPPMFVERTPDLVRVFVPDEGYEVTSVEVRHVGACDDLAVPIGDGWLLDLTLFRTALARGGSRAMHEHEGRVFVRREGGALRVHEKIPRDVATTMRMRDARAELWLSPRRYWASLRVDAVVESDGPFVVLDAGALLHDDGCGTVTPGARLRAVAVEDARPWAIVNDRLVIATGGRPARIRVEIDGLLPSLEDRAGTAELTDWMFDLPGAPDLPVAVTVFHDADLSLIASGGGSPIAAPAGWAGVRFEPRDPPILTLQPRRHGAPVEIAAERGMSFTVDPLVARCSDRIVALAARLPELGPLPGHHDVVVRSAGTRGDAVWDPGHIAIDEAPAMNLCREDGALEELEDFDTIDAGRLVLHELAHVWFGGEVASLDDEAAAVWESLAEYVAIEALPPAQAQRVWESHRAKLRTDAGSAFGVAQRVNRNSELRNYLSYVAGPLVLRTIADYLGRDTMQEVLRAYVRTNRGHYGSWVALRAAIAAVAGEDAAAWADPWLREPFPRLVVKDVVYDGGHLRGTIVAEGTARAGELTIRLGAHGENPVVQVPFGPTPTRFDLPVGDENMIVIDPEDRVPFVLAPDAGRREWNNGGMWFEIDDLVGKR